MKRNKTASHTGFFSLRGIFGLVLGLSGIALASVALKPTAPHQVAEERFRTIPTLGEDGGDEAVNLGRLEQWWNDRLTYPTGRFNPAWLRAAVAQHDKMQKAIPAGNFSKLQPRKMTVTKRVGRRLTTEVVTQANSLSTAAFTPLGPAPERMTGCTGCFDYTTTNGRINAIVVDPASVTGSPPLFNNGSIVAYAGTVGGGVWKTTNCCTSATSWTVTTEDPLIAVTAIDTLAIDPNNHNTVYAGTGDLNYGSFSMGSQGILKTIDGGQHWTLLGASVFGPAYTEPAGQFPQYDSVGKVRVDPNNSNNVVAGTKKGLFFSYDGGNNWAGPCTTNSFNTMRQDITGLELTNMGGGVTRILAAVGVRGFASPVQYDLGQNGANGIYIGNMVSSGCPTFTASSTNANGFVYGTGIPVGSGAGGGAGYSTGQSMNGASGVIYGGVGVGNQLGRIELAVAPSNSSVIYAQVQSIAPNNNSGGNAGCGNANGCQLGAWVSTNGGTSWTFMAGSAGGSLRPCAGSGGGSNAGQAGDYPQNWYDQGVAVDPTDPTRVFFDTYVVYYATQGGTSWYDTSCGYTQTGLGMHADQHVLTFVPGSKDILIAAGDGSADATTNASAVVPGTTRPAWFHMVNGFNAIEFYAGDISANFANDASPIANGGAQDNGPSSATFPGGPTGPVQWQMGLGGDGFSGMVNSGGTGPNSAQGTITVSGAAVAGETFQVGSQVFTFQAGTRTGVGQVQLSTSTTTEATNITSAINADVGSAVAVRSGSTVIVSAADGGTAGNSITFTENVTNMTMNGSGTLGGTVSGGTVAGTTQPVLWQGNNSGSTSRCVNNCTVGGATWTTNRGGWFNVDQQQFSLPVNLFHGGIPGGDDCVASTACGHILVGTTRVWETITGNANQSNMSTIWYQSTPSTCNGTNACLTKGTLGNRSFITMIKYSPKYSSVGIVSTNDGNVQIGFNLGSGKANSGTWVDVTGGNAVLPNRPALGCALDPTVAVANTPVGYAAVGGFNANTPTTPGHVFQVTCAANCASFNWADKTGNLPDIPVESIIVNPNYPQQVFAGTDWGVYFTNDVTQASPTWYRFDGAPHTMVWDMSIDRGSTALALWTRGRGAWVFPLTSTDIALPAPILQSAVSRMTHGDAGPFDLNLPINGRGIEPRSDGTGNYQLILTFDKPLTNGGASVSAGTGSANSVTTSGNTMTVNLTGVTDQQTVSVSTSSVSGTNTFTAAPFVLNVGFLAGDVNQDGTVNVGDTVSTRSHAGEVLDNTNSQYDVNVDGMINVGDTIFVRSRSSDFLP